MPRKIQVRYSFFRYGSKYFSKSIFPKGMMIKNDNINTKKESIYLSNPATQSLFSNIAFVIPLIIFSRKRKTYLWVKM